MVQIIASLSVLTFTALMLGIGLYCSKKSKSMDDFLLGGRNIGPWMSAFAYGTSYFSAVVFIGYAGMHGWRIGVGSMWIGVGNAVLGCWLAWMVLAKPTRRMTHTLNSSTMPELFEARYKCTGMKIYSAAIIFIFLVPYAASVYKGLGSLFSAVFPGVSETVCMFIVAALTGFYLILGGYLATALTDFIQGIIIIIGVVIMIAAVLMRPEVGGLVEGIRRINEIDPQLTNIWGGSSGRFLIVNIALTSFGVWGLPQMVHKYYAIKDEGSIGKATVISTLFAALIGIGAYFIGTFGRLFIPANAQGLPDVAGGFDSVVPTMLIEIFSGSVMANLVLSIILLLLLSASMSTLAAVVLTSSSAISVDLIKVVKPSISDKSQVSLTRAMCLVFITLSFVFATMNISFIVNLMSFSWGIVAGSFVGPFIWGVYSKKVTKAGAWAGLLSGLVVVGTMIAYTTITGGFAAAKALSPEFGVIAMVVSFIIVPIVSAFTPKYDKEHIEAVFTQRVETKA